MLKVYLVRHLETKKCAGVVISQGVEDLFDTVDEYANPNEMQYMEVSSRWQIGGFLGGELLGNYADMFNRRWKTFSQLLNKPYQEWYTDRVARMREEMEDQIAQGSAGV